MLALHFRITELNPFLREKGVLGREQERERKETDRQTAAAIVYCILAHALGMLSWLFDETLQCRMVIIFRLQHI